VPTNIKVIRANDFIRATPEGDAYLENAERLLKEIAQAGAGLEEFEVLVDTRRIIGALSATDLWTLAEKLVKFRRTFAHKTAILCPLEKFDQSQFFALCAENRGFNIQAFTGYEEAMEWLIADQT
jgi:DNA-binding transcriptional LysR family regulator